MRHDTFATSLHLRWQHTSPEWSCRQDGNGASVFVGFLLWSVRCMDVCSQAATWKEWQQDATGSYKQSFTLEGSRTDLTCTAVASEGTHKRSRRCLDHRTSRLAHRFQSACRGAGGNSPFSPTSTFSETRLLSPSLPRLDGE